MKDTKHILSALTEIIFKWKPELFDKVENAIYEYSETFTKHTFPLTFTYVMKMVNEINQITNLSNTQV